MDYVLRTEDLTKIYSKTKVVDGVSLCIRPGEIYGFVGKNGAGKTTFIRMVLGLAKKSGGIISYFDGVSALAARKRIGSLVEAPSFYPNMSAKENIEIFCRMIGEDPKQSEEILEKVGLGDTGKKKAGRFSLGMKQRLGIGFALVGDPELLMLDEPINGLDPTGIAEVRRLILDLKNEHGKTIFISSHLISELVKIATRYGVIAKGRLAEEITAAELEEKCRSRTSVMTNKPEKAAELIRSFLNTDNITIKDDGAVLIGEKIENIGAVTNELYKNDIVVSSISTDEGAVEAYFIEKMEGG